MAQGDRHARSMEEFLMDNHEFGGISIVAFASLAAFAIDRVVTSLLFGLSFSEAWRKFCPDPALFSEPNDKLSAERMQKAAYFGFAGMLTMMTLWLLGQPFLHLIAPLDARRPLDYFLSALVLIGGAERVGEFQKSLGQPAVPSDPPVQIKGTLILEEGTSIEHRASTASSAR
jgi:hypothetical protein